MRQLRGIGYWIDTEVLDYNEEARKLHEQSLKLPDPQRLLEVLGPHPADSRFVAYLRSGHELQACLGYSYCRFHCGIDEEQLGCRDLTDGLWVWPEGLWHYVEGHQVPLPEAFLATVAERNWRVPEESALKDLREVGWSLTYWKEWYAVQVIKDEE